MLVRTLQAVDVGGPELLLVLIVAVFLFGAKKLPDLARGSGRAVRIFREELRGTERPEAPATSEE
ncbi:twin-arginine translocase TatA/TatE family subunit [Nocardioides sp. CER19]|nr:twin-arginine translocase TatA/TatE family subunit [Nocardioides sp. CER19]MDH2415276.1 twin-arginine translocase TatA/TatE family subunit [Nocardioides sp. CER19]